MLTVWRLVKTKYSRSAFDGEGSRLYGGRWSSPGTVVAYASESPALAVLEVLVHLQNATVLQSYSLASADVPDELVEAVARRQLPPNWTKSPPPPEAQGIGDAWARGRRSAALRVPSVIVGRSYNYLLNPAHPSFARIRIRDPRAFTFDSRLAGPK